MIEFKDIEIRQWFVLENEVFIKTIDVEGADIFEGEGTTTYNCINITCSTLDWCPPSAKCIILERPIFVGYEK